MYRYYIKDHGRKRLVEYPEKEAIQLAELIGFDFKTETNYRWFLQQALNTLLPMGWKRESDPFGNVHYHNEKTQVTTKNNPLVYKFRKGFERYLKNNMESLVENEKSPDNKLGKNQQIAISSFEEQEAIFKKLMEKSQNPELGIGEKFQEIMKEAEEFYETIFEEESCKPPKNISESLKYQLVNPEEMADLAREYKIILEPHLMWIARVALVLPLPPFWESEIDALGDKVYTNTEITHSQHEPPYHSFLMKYIQKVKQLSGGGGEHFMTFYDKNSVRYVVDLTKLPSKRDYIILKDDKPDPEFQKKALYFKPQLTSEEALTDAMIFEISQSVGIDMNKELHLISAVYQIIETIKSKNILKNWDFRITTDGNKYWYNTKDKRSLPYFPYKDEIKKYVRVARKDAISNAKTTIRTFSERHKEFQAYGKEFYERCKKEAFIVTECLIKKHMDLPFPSKSDSFQASSLIKAHLKRKDNMQEYLDLVFACPFNFGNLIPSDSSQLDPSHMSIDMPFDFPSQESKILHQMTEQQIEEYIKEKIQKESSEPNTNFIRNKGERRNTTIALDTIPSDAPTRFDMRRFKTIGREDDGVIIEIDSSEEDSKTEILQEESESSDEYEELQQLVEEKIEQPKTITKISTIRMAASRKNTIESIIMKERMDSFGNDGNKRSSSDLSALQSDESPEVREVPSRAFDKVLEKIYGKNSVSDEIKVVEEEKSEVRLKRTVSLNPTGYREKKEVVDSKKSDELMQNSKKKVKSFGEVKPRDRLIGEYINENDKKEYENQDPEAIENKMWQEKYLSELEEIQKDPIHRKVSLIIGTDSPAKRLDNRKSGKFKEESISEQMEFSPIDSKSEQQSIFEDELAEIDIDRNNDKFKLESENSSISQPVVKRLMTQKSLKSMLVFEDNQIIIKPSSLRPDLIAHNTEKFSATDDIQWEIHRGLVSSNTLKTMKTPSGYVRKSTSPLVALNKLDLESGAQYKGIVYETEKRPKNAEENADSNTNFNLSRQSSLKKSPSIRTSPNTQHFIPGSRKNTEDSEINKLRIMTLKSIEKGLEKSMDKSSNSEKISESEQSELVQVVSDKVLKENNEANKKIFEEIFSPLSLKNSPLSFKSSPNLPILGSSPANLDVFGARILRIPRKFEEPTPPLRPVIPKKLEPIEEKLTKIEKTESLPELKPKTLLEIPKKLTPISPQSFVIQEKLLFMYYLELIGHPNSSRSSLNFFYTERHIQPQDVLNMAKRLSLRVNPIPYLSIESDLIWISYLQIATPMPAGFNSHTRISTILNWPLGKHPGDVYFTLLCKCQRRLRNKELKKMNKQQKIESLIGFSWCKFVNEKNKNYYFNFLTGDKSEYPPQLNEIFDVHAGVRRKNKLKDILTQDSDIQEIMMKYDIEGNYKDDRFYNLSNYIIQTVISNESVDEEYRSSAGSSSAKDL